MTRVIPTLCIVALAAALLVASPAPQAGASDSLLPIFGDDLCGYVQGPDALRIVPLGLEHELEQATGEVPIVAELAMALDTVPPAETGHVIEIHSRFVEGHLAFDLLRAAGYDMSPEVVPSSLPSAEAATHYTE